jgi:hypothetical protein
LSVIVPVTTEEGSSGTTELLDPLVSLLLDCDEEEASELEDSTELLLDTLVTLELEEGLTGAVEGSPLTQRTLCP